MLARLVQSAEIERYLVANWDSSGVGTGMRTFAAGGRSDSRARRTAREEKWKCTLQHRERAKEANGPLLIAKFVVLRRSQPVPSAAVLVSARLAIRPA